MARWMVKPSLPHWPEAFPKQISHLLARRGKVALSCRNLVVHRTCLHQTRSTSTVCLTVGKRLKTFDSNWINKFLQVSNSETPEALGFSRRHSGPVSEVRLHTLQMSTASRAALLALLAGYDLAETPFEASCHKSRECSLVPMARAIAHQPSAARSSTTGHFVCPNRKNSVALKTTSLPVIM